MYPRVIEGFYVPTQMKCQPQLTLIQNYILDLIEY